MNARQPLREDQRLPRSPEALQVEIELTSACNARCTACPRSDMPTSGLMAEETLEDIITLYRRLRKKLKVNRVNANGRFPSVTVAGGGEPTLHPQAPEFLRRLTTAGFKTHLITNGSRMSPEWIDSIAASGISSISISFWGIRKDEYEAAMMLPFEGTLAKVQRLSGACREASIPLQIVWVRSPQITSTDEEIQRFWKAVGIPVDLGDTIPWNRGGLLGPPRRENAVPGQYLPDPSRRIWCTDMFFSDSYRWNGDCILCCCNFFKRDPIRLGNIATDGFDHIASEKEKILNRRPLPPMCRSCELPRANRAKWLAGPWLDRIPAHERSMLLGPEMKKIGVPTPGPTTPSNKDVLTVRADAAPTGLFKRRNQDQ